MTSTASKTRTVLSRTFRATVSGVCAKTGDTFPQYAEIYKNPDGAGYIWFRVSAPVANP